MTSSISDVNAQREREREAEQSGFKLGKARWWKACPQCTESSPDCVLLHDCLSNSNCKSITSAFI